MKKVFYSLAVVVFVLAFVSCSSDDHDDSGTSLIQKNTEARAVALGYDNVQSYEANVAEQCAAGNHENCDIQTDGKHLVCGYKGHSGTKHNGENHNGTDHGTHDINGNHNNHDGNKNGGGHH